MKLAEGEAGVLRAYVLPRGEGVVGHVAVHHIKPLCLHYRVAVEAAAGHVGPTCTMVVTGDE